MPNASNDTDSNLGKAENCPTRQMETTATPIRYGKGKWGKGLQERYTATWQRPGGNTRRQIDYIMINAKRRNVTSKAQIDIYRHSNINKNRHHRVQTMHIYYNASEKYKQPIPAETGARLKYDIKGLRLHPKKLSIGHQAHVEDKETKELQEQQHEWGEWNSYNGAIGGMIEKYTHSTKKRQSRRNQNGR